MPDGNSQTENHEKTASTQENQSQKTVSPRKLRANRENAQKSTGPKTARGKRHSSFKHGLQAKKVMFAGDGKLLDEGLQCLFESLHDRYSSGEVVDELLVELAITDYWRLQKGLEYEIKYLTPGGGEFHPQGGMLTLVRYMTANRRAFDQSLQMLKQLPANQHSKAKTAESDSDPLETDASTAPHEGGNTIDPAGTTLQNSAEAEDAELPMVLSDES